MQSAFNSLQLAKGSHGLDAGCGVGLHAEMLADIIGSAGTVAGLDISPEFIDYARKLVREKKGQNHISFQVGDVNHLPFEDNFFAWALSVDCVGYAPGNPLPALKEMERVLKPGGQIAILFWSSQQLLPGYPRLEARLNATVSGIAPFHPEYSPESHPFRLLRPISEAGFCDIDVRTFTGSFHAPLSQDIRDGLIALFDMRWQNTESELSEKDHQLFEKLCDANSPDFILNIPEYYAFFTYSMFVGWAND